MRPETPTTSRFTPLALALLACGWIGAAPARADDSDGMGTEPLVPGLSSTVPGMGARSAPMQRPGHENPEMRGYVLAPTHSAEPGLAAKPLAAAPAAAGPVDGMQDIGRLLRQAEAALQARHAGAAAAELEQAETALLNARAAGAEQPAQAIGPVGEALAALHHGDRPAATQATEAAIRVLGGAG